MSPARALQPAPERILTLAEQLDGPCVLIDFAPDVSTVQRSEVLDGETGPRASTIVRTVARACNVRAATLDAEPDETTADTHVFYVLHRDRRIARVYGLTLDAFIDAVISVAILDRPDRRAAKIRRLVKDGLYEAPNARDGRL